MSRGRATDILPIENPGTWRLTYEIANTRFRGRADVRLLGEYVEGTPIPNPWALLPQDNGPTLAVAIDRLIAEELNSPVQIIGAHNASGAWLLGLYGLERCTEPDQAHRAVDAALGVVHAVQEEIRASRGRPTGSGAAFADAIEYLESVARFTEWAIENKRSLLDRETWPADAIAQRLGPQPDGISESQMFEENRRAKIGLDDIRNSRITWTYVESQRGTL